MLYIMDSMADFDLRIWEREIVAGRIPSVEEMMTKLLRQGVEPQQVRDATIRTLVSAGGDLEEIIPEILKFAVEENLGPEILFDLYEKAGRIQPFLVRAYGFVDYMGKALPEYPLMMPHRTASVGEEGTGFYLAHDTTIHLSHWSNDVVNILRDREGVMLRLLRERRPGLDIPDDWHIRNVTPELLYASILDPESH